MKTKKDQSFRSKTIQFSLNDEEYGLVCHYMKKYKISNRSNMCREVIVSYILKTLEKDYPTLFEENEMRR